MRQQNDASLGSPGKADSTAVLRRTRAVLLVTSKTALFFVWTGDQDVNAAQHRPGVALLQVHPQIQGVRAPSSTDTAAAVQPQPVQLWPPEGRRAVGLKALVSANRHELPNMLCSGLRPADSRLEEVLGVQQGGIDLGRRLVASAHDKDLGRSVPGGAGLGGRHGVEQLLKCVQQAGVVLGPACMQLSASQLVAVHRSPVDAVQAAGQHLQHTACKRPIKNQS